LFITTAINSTFAFSTADYLFPPLILPESPLILTHHSLGTFLLSLMMRRFGFGLIVADGRDIKPGSASGSDRRLFAATAATEGHHRSAIAGRIGNYHSIDLSLIVVSEVCSKHITKTNNSSDDF
jgi:hypothetical protein